MPTRYAKILGAFAIMGWSAVAGGADPLQRFQTEPFSQSTDLGALSANVRLALNRFVGGANIANSGEPFEATDVIVDRRLPRRRLIRTGANGDLTSVEYDHGGIGLHQHFVLFQVRGTDAIAVNACSGLLPREMEKLRKIVGKSGCRWKATEH